MVHYQYKHFELGNGEIALRQTYLFYEKLRTQSVHPVLQWFLIILRIILAFAFESAVLCKSPTCRARFPFVLLKQLKKKKQQACISRQKSEVRRIAILIQSEIQGLNKLYMDAILRSRGTGNNSKISNRFHDFGELGTDFVFCAPMSF